MNIQNKKKNNFVSFCSLGNLKGHVTPIKNACWSFKKLLQSEKITFVYSAEQIPNSMARKILYI